MPNYTFKNKETGELVEIFMSIPELDLFLKENNNLKQVLSAPLISSGRGSGKPDESFRDLLRDMKKKNSQGISRSTINTF